MTRRTWHGRFITSPQPPSPMSSSCKACKAGSPPAAGDGGLCMAHMPFAHRHSEGHRHSEARSTQAAHAFRGPTQAAQAVSLHHSAHKAHCAHSSVT
mmetsp:Transcript_4832/g.13194  ORF Transcript_4832/g.13194 Transcript_4832/m.13194 type:complete len:97 (-) Transcript_4832:615-905(-)